nr:L1 13.6 kDa protein [Human mastadenovirus C]
MRADREELDLPPPVGGVAVDVVKVEVPATGRTLVLAFVKTCAVLAAVHGLYILHEVDLTTPHKEAEWEFEPLAWRVWLVVFYFGCLSLTVWLLEGSYGGSYHHAARAQSPDVRARRSELDDNIAQMGAVHGLELPRRQVRRELLQVYLA